MRKSGICVNSILRHKQTKTQGSLIKYNKIWASSKFENLQHLYLILHSSDFIQTQN